MKFFNIFLAALTIGVVCPPFVFRKTSNPVIHRNQVGTYGISGGVIINTYSGRVVSYREKGSWTYTEVYGTDKEFQPFSRSEILTEE